MNILTQKFPNTVTNNYGTFKIVTDYREWLDFEMMIMVDSTNEEKLLKLLSLYKDSDLVLNESNIKEMVDSLMWFYKRGKEEGGETKSTPCFSFVKDADYIYSDFIRFYGIDLSSDDMHWWKFRNLFEQLPKESKTKEVMMYRSMPISSKMSQEQKQFYSKMKSLYSLNTKPLKPKSVGSILFGGMKSI